MHRLFFLAAALPLALLLGPKDDEPRFGVACGSTLDGPPDQVFLHAGHNSPSTIRVSIQPDSAHASAPADSSVRLDVVSGPNRGSCWTDGPSPFHVYLNNAAASTATISIRSNHPITFRGLRGDTQRASVIVGAGTTKARLSW